MTSVLNDDELSGLFLGIVRRGGAGRVHEILKGGRILGYKDYSLTVMNLDCAGSTVQSCQVQIWRRSRLLGNIGNRQVIGFIHGVLRDRYGPTGSIRHVHPRDGSILNLTGDTRWGSESEIVYEPNSQGDQKNGAYSDFICFKFHRCYD